jgi:flagellar biosynthetic protein FliQ
MTPQYVIQLGQQAIVLMLLISAPMLLAGLVVGLGVSILQAVTQVHEVTLTFIPKILAVVLALFLFLPWMLNQMTRYSTEIFTRIAGVR